MNVDFYMDRFSEPGRRVVPIEDRGYQYGDGVYEVIRAYGGVPFMLAEHLDRLERSVAAVRMALPFGRERIAGIVTEALERSQLAEALVYFQISRGSAPRRHAFPPVEPVLALTVRPTPPAAPEKYRDGVSATLLPDERWANCYIKSINLLPNVLARQIAFEGGHDEAVFVRDGRVTEGSSSNFFAVKDGALHTHPADRWILNGITRIAVLRLAAAMNVTVHEKAFSPEWLAAADEAFVASTTAEVLPVRAIDGRTVGDGRPGPLSLRLLEGLRTRAGRATP